MTRRNMPLKAGLAILAMATLIGCSASQPTQFYTLSGIDTVSEASAEKPMRLGVGPVYLPGYLDRPQVVTRSGANRMNVSEFDQWAEPLETTFQRVLTENLSDRLDTDRIATLPARRDMPLDHQVEVEVTRFDADETGQAVLDARWRIFDGRGDRLLHRGRSLTEERVTGADDYEQIAAAMSRCLAAMTEEIADALVAH
ncbi:MAG: PqiC family protein [Geminicoccaceae bacterium]